MTSASPTISIRLPKVTRASLDKASKLLRRSRSYIMQEALNRHLQEIVADETDQSRLTNLRSLAGVGRDQTKKRDENEIDEHVRWLRSRA
jgi:predicted DNA-binding protein